jgi:folate-binding protein YgfZ
MGAILPLVSTADQAARASALLVARPDLGTLVVTGSERLSWLQGILTCDVAELRAGEGAWGLLLTRQGKILADVLVVAGETAAYLGVVRDAVGRTRDYLGTFLIMEDADLSDESAEHAWITLHGPEASAIARRVAAEHGGSPAGIDVTGLGGAALVIDRAAAAAARAAVLADRAQPQPVEATAEDFLRLRVERLVPLYGVDMDEQRSPHEVSLDRRTVSWSKGCYLGQEAVCMQDMRGKVKRRLALVRVTAPIPPAAGTKVLDESGAVVGETRSAANSALVGGPAALAFLTAAVAVPGVRLTVGGASAEVIEPR